MLKIKRKTNVADYYRSDDEHESEIQGFIIKRRHIILVWSALIAVMIGGVIIGNMIINDAGNVRVRELIKSGAIQWVKPK